MSDMKTITVYKTPTCGTCRVVFKRLDDAGIPYEAVDLTEHEDILLDLKRRLERDTIHAPLIQFGTKLGTIADLTQIMRDYQAQPRSR